MQTVDAKKVERYIQEALANELDQAGFVKSVKTSKVEGKNLYVFDVQVVLQNPKLLPTYSKLNQLDAKTQVQVSCKYVAEPVDQTKVRVVWKSMEKTETLAT